MKRFRFSLLTLVLFVMLIGSASGLWYRWEPWVLERTFEGDWNGGYSPEGPRLTTTLGNDVLVWDMKTGKNELLLSGHKDDVKNAAFSPDGNRIVTISEDRFARIWDATTGEMRLKLKSSNRYVPSAFFSTDGMRVFTQCDNVVAWDATTGEELFSTDTHNEAGSLLGTCQTQDGRFMVSRGCGWCALRVYDAKNGKTIQSLPLCFWDKEFSELADGDQDGGEFTRISLSQDGKSLLASVGETIYVWALENRTFIAKLPGCADMDACFSQDGQQIIASYTTGKIVVWDVKSRKERLRLNTENLQGPASFSPDERRIVAPCGAIKIWDANDGRLLSALDFGQGTPQKAQFLPDGRIIAFESGLKVTRVWSLRRPEGGIAWIPELWLTVLLTVAFLASLWRSRVRDEPRSAQLN